MFQLWYTGAGGGAGTSLLPSQGHALLPPLPVHVLVYSPVLLQILVLLVVLVGVDVRLEAVVGGGSVDLGLGRLRLVLVDVGLQAYEKIKMEVF